MVWQPEIEELQRRHALAEGMGGPEGVARQHARGKLTIRERLALLVDEGSLREMAKLQGGATYGDDGALLDFTPIGSVRGTARINGRRVYVSGQDFTVRGGSAGGKARVDDGGVDIGHGHPGATELLLPTVNLLDGAGGSVQEYADLNRTYIPDGEVWEHLSNIVSLAPVVSAVLGPAAGGLAPFPPMSHFSVIAKGTGQVFPGGPPVVKAALGIDIDKEELGGWKIHTRVSGVVDNAAEDEADAIAQVKRFLSYMPDNVYEMPPRVRSGDDPARRDERLLSIIPRDIRKTYDPRVIIEGVFDTGSFFEIAPDYGGSRIIGLARADGYPVGVMTNNPKRLGGSMDVAAAEKSTRLVQICDTFHIPMVVIMDEPGFLVGVESERRGIERAGARLVHAICQSKMPWISFLSRRTFGLAGTLQYRPGPHLFRRYAWVSGRWGSMHIEGGTDAAFRRVIAAAPDPDAKRAELEDGFRRIASPFRTAEASGLDLIDPRDTRAILCDFVDMAQGVIETQLGPGGGPHVPALMQRFEELQVVEIAGSQAGALAGKLFADYGARVVKVEPPGGDPLRANGEPWGGMGSEFAFLNTSKRSVRLDLDSDAGLRRLAPLIERADVVIESAAPDPLQPRTASLGGERLVRVYVSPFGLGEPAGPGGPYARYRSNVFTDDAIGGHLWVGGDMDREPLQRRGLHTHMQAGLHAFIGAMAALLARERIGRGQSVDVSHQDGMASLHQHTTTMWTHGGHIIERAGNGQAGPWHPAGVYPCRDGYVFLGHSTGVKLVPFVEVLGYGHLFDDPRFATDPARAVHKREFDAALTERLMQLSVDEITELGRAVFSPIGPVPTMLEVLEDEQYQARDFWVRLSPQPADAPTLRFPRGPFSINGQGARPTLPPAGPDAEIAEDIAADWTTPAPPVGRESLTTGPLDGLRVLDLTRVWAGPIAGRILGDLGADVIHVESPWNRGYRERDPLMATLGHLFPDNEPGERPWNRVGGVNKLARNKRGLTLNLQDARGRDLFAALVARSDVVIENYSPRVMPKLGFDFASLRKLNPRIVHTAMNGYGASGPGQNRVALGPVIEAAVGLTAMMGYADTGPYRSGVAWADPIAGLSAVCGTLVALWRREASGGEPQQVETAMSESMAVAAGEELLAAQVRGANAPRIGNRHAVYAPQGVYPCAGHDRWLAISVMTDAEWAALCDVAGIAGDLRDLDAAGRRARHDEIDAAIGVWTCAQSPGPAMARLQARGVIAAQVSDGRDLVEDPQLAARDFWAELDHADVGPMRYPGNAIRLSETPVTYRVASPGLGEHNAEILRPLGVSDEELSTLEAEGVIAQMPPETPPQ